MARRGGGETRKNHACAPHPFLNPTMYSSPSNQGGANVPVAEPPRVSLRLLVAHDALIRCVELFEHSGNPICSSRAPGTKPSSTRTCGNPTPPAPSPAKTALPARSTVPRQWRPQGQPGTCCCQSSPPSKCQGSLRWVQGPTPTCPLPKRISATGQILVVSVSQWRYHIYKLNAT